MMYYHNAWEDLGMHVSFKAIGRNIRAARTELGITQEDAAERLKISQLHFGRLAVSYTHLTLPTNSLV